MMLGALFTHPVQWSTDGLLWLVLPLCAAVAVVYKAARTKHLRRLPLEIAVTFVLMLVGMAVLAVGLWLVQEYAA